MDTFSKYAIVDRDRAVAIITDNLDVVGEVLVDGLTVGEEVIVFEYELHFEVLRCLGGGRFAHEHSWRKEWDLLLERVERELVPLKWRNE